MKDYPLWGSIVFSIEGIMNKRELKKFKDLLLQRRQAITQTNQSINEQSVVFDPDDLADEVDLAASETDQSLNLKLRDRERFLLKKIDKALQKIESGDYGNCESCGEAIGVKRLEARPVTDLCIRCKEEQEARERVFAED
jgi:DnaK suppressor protein